MSIHPIKGTGNIEQAYKRYLSTAFYMNNNSVQKQFENLLSKKNKFVKGPYLEITNPYKQGSTLEDLIEEGILSPFMNSLNQKEMPKDRPLYSHQEKAIRKAGEKRNFIVATGTGSGKTESFLLPILNELFREKEQGTLGPGVRALLVYPMNALANDQVKRLRTLLTNNPEITFGRFTGETKNKKGEAEEHYRNQNDGIERLPNELLSREEMRQAPPNILITNYAMLEYLLLRPEDTEFFDGPYSNDWKFIVLDEAHTYNGAKGIEVGMLLRRLKDRILKKRPMRGSIQCIATSATLGSGDKAKQKVMSFAGNLFNEPFYWDPLIKKEQDLIEAERINYVNHFSIWGAPNWKAYRYLSDSYNESELKNLETEKLIQYGYPKKMIEELLCQSLKSTELLYELIKGDRHLIDLHIQLSEKPKLLSSLVESLIQKEYIDQDHYLDPKDGEELLTTFVDMAVKAKDKEGELPLLPARYHVFVRAIEGAYLAFLPEKKLFLDTRKQIKDGQRTYPLFETGVCDSCGQIHLIGEEKEGKLVQQSGSNPDPDSRFNAYMIVDENYETIIDEDEEVNVGEEKVAETTFYELCPGCSTINRQGVTNKEVCCDLHGKVDLVLLTREVIVRNKQAKCHKCGKRSQNPIRLFVTGQDAATSVLATALYQELVKSSGKTEDNQLPGLNVNKEDDFFAFLNEENTDVKVDQINYQPQKLLIFSDSRQDAAFFAPYLERTYYQIMWRRLIYEVIEEKQKDDIRLEDLILPIEKKAVEAQLFDSGMSPTERKNIIKTRLMRELLQIDGRHSLEGVGLVSFHIPIPEIFKTFLPNLAQKFGVKPEEVWTLFEALFDSFRIQNALLYPEGVDPDNQIFAPRIKAGYMNGYQTIKKEKVSSWVPSENRLNRRLDYLARIYEKQGKTRKEAEELAKNFLKIIWDQLISSGRLGEYFPKAIIKDIGTVFHMSYRHWYISTNKKTWYQCDTCGTWTTRSVENVCPSMRCRGTLITKDPAEIQFKNHYRKLYTEMIPMKMKTKEHTAQLSTNQATAYQQDFIDNKLNVLSCSTTFEMGVDVGGLESVFMRNVPPETANYIQRAGRAGRRKSTTAYSLTYAQRRSHDLSYFTQPETIIAGDIKPPLFKMENLKIIRRHIHSVALAAFFKEYPNYFGKLENFFRYEERDSTEKGVPLIREFLRARPSQILNSLRRIVPVPLQPIIDLKNWGWLKEFEGENGILNKAEGIYEKDLSELNKMWQESINNKKPNTDYLLRMMETLKDRQLLSFLSSHNVLPKYGFPVDVVELQIIGSNQNTHQVTLSRDLALAVSEYAPGSEVVANGKVFRSVGVKRIAKYELPTHQYTHCRHCGHYQTISKYATKEDKESHCESCQNPIRVQSFISPIFGFVSNKNSQPGEFRPEKAFRSRIFFSEYDLKAENTESEKEGSTTYGNMNINWKYSPYGKLAVVNDGRRRGYHICNACGIEKNLVKKANKTTHTSAWGSVCSGSFEHYNLGHEFMSDVIELSFSNLPTRIQDSAESFWSSFLYGILDGASAELGIDRKDIDGTIYYKDNQNPSLIIFDSVPGGAGYTKEISEHLNGVLDKTLIRLKNCSCGEETSCYGCLKNYSNQYCHDSLSRGIVINVLEMVKEASEKIKKQS
ncbi:DEAD/DEAH box helicase [Priestia megaterium]|uniref:DEAD/DEAH box helicase n=1 Tax=Priestia megaterium TaxID=1404 RepID=UPI0011A8F3AC|nr:DEAD/DEAH box helicase [Priestia megaterium]